ncbi:MAG: DUF1761 domain-containing protein [Candidatus Peregrinibacteria bacterium]|nr:DUF1761 domain-containing protein [Candidatus Peregrinibacteria bacterium]
MDVEVNFIAMLVAVAASMVIGGIWYSPLLFADVWLKETGLASVSKEKMKAAAGKAMLITFLSEIVKSYVLTQVAAYAGSTTLLEGATLGFWLWLGFVATVIGTLYAFGQKSLKLFFIDAGHELIAFVVMGAIIASMT